MGRGLREVAGGKALLPGRTAFEILDLIETSEDGSTWSHWWRRWASTSPSILSCNSTNILRLFSYALNGL